jgi:hypothetical protein
VGFFIRKAFRLGPLRLNLSRSGIGLSAGVTGARLGVTSRGQPYVFGGRHGLYVRENLGPRLGSSRSRTAGGDGDHLGGGPVRLYEDTGATYAEEAPIIPLADERQAVPASGGVTRAAGLVLLGGLILLVLDGPVAWIPGASLLLTGGWQAASGLRRKGEAARVRALLGGMIRSGAWAPDVGEKLRLRGADGTAPPPPWLRRELEAAFLEVCRTVASGERLDGQELELVHRLETLLGGASSFTRGARVDAFRSLASLLVADHDLTPEEERVLDQVREGLGLEPSEIEGELALLGRLRELRTIRDGDLPQVEVSVPLRQGETAHFEGEGRLLRERQLRRFQRNHIRYSVRGFTLDREGRLIITDRRVLLVDAGAYEIPVREVRDLEVDLDQNLLRITRDGRVNPVFLTAPDAMRAGAVLAAVTGM